MIRSRLNESRATSVALDLIAMRARLHQLTCPVMVFVSR